MFTIALNDFTSHLILPHLIKALEECASNIDLRTVPNMHINAQMLLEKAEIDVAIGVFVNPSSRLRLHTLLTSPWICIMQRGHPLASQELTLERYIEAKHLLVTLTGESTGLIEPFLQEQGIKRNLSINSILHPYQLKYLLHWSR